MIGGIGNIGSMAGMPGMSGMPGMGGTSGMPKMGEGAQPSAGGDESQSFGDIFKDMVVDRPTEAYNDANSLAVDLALGKDVDPQQVAIAQAVAGLEVQMATRTISSAVQGLRTLMQTQV